ncbi:MAG TPA: hypothetical protein VK158_01635 [Acidobacteriota bacterium]|nr:hypothetical protein [Acidobacteriota bacterium]
MVKNLTDEEIRYYSTRYVNREITVVKTNDLFGIYFDNVRLYEDFPGLMDKALGPVPTILYTHSKPHHTQDHPGTQSSNWIHRFTPPLTLEDKIAPVKKHSAVEPMRLF